MTESSGAHAEDLPLLLEIGSEEIPARFVPTALEELSRRLTALLEELQLAHDPVRTVATPRRLAAFCPSVACRQPDRHEEVKGPPVSVAFDADGQPTKAAIGFARKVGVDLEECGRATDQRGEFLKAERTIVGREAVEVLGERLPELILGLPFRKVMRWGTGDIEYARPLQWLVCLHGDRVVPFTIGVLASGRTTRGHRTLAEDRRHDLANPAEYWPAMAELSVMVEPQERRRRIEAQAEEILARSPEPARWREDPELLTEVVFLCEHPTVFRGEFDEEFFELPDEVIVTALRAHQRYFAIARADGAGLVPGFLAVRDGGDRVLAQVRAGNERVLRARLADALFYWRFDQRRTPDDHTNALATVTWLEGFGSMLDKVQRTRRLVEYVWQAGLGDGEALPVDLRRAAEIARFDLVTEMIRDGKEFTKLEGVIGARYAAEAGESAGVCRIIERQYLPRTAAGELPGDCESSVLSIASRLDTLAGCWVAGFAPTGAKDPYGLRRHALAVLRILLDLEVRFDLAAAVAVALEPFATDGAPFDLAGAEELVAFLRVRLEGEFVEACGTDLAVVRAVLAVHILDPTNLRRWAQALEGFRDREDFLLLATGFKRCKNILKGDVLPPDERDASFDRWLAGGRGRNGEVFDELPEPAERALAAQIGEAVPGLFDQVARESYVEVFQTLSRFGPAIDRFFDEVRVNVEEPSLRAVRHAFLREIHALFLRYADFSLVAPGDE